MRKLIAEQRHYTIAVNVQKNRLFLTLRGFWLDPSKLSEYVADISLAAKALSSPFTALVDVREMNTPGHQVKDIHVTAQKNCVKAGLAASAEVFPIGISRELELESYSVESQLKRRGFKSIRAAEDWLDNIL